MSSRGQKRTEAVEEFPADKRPCSSSRPSSSNSSEAQTTIKTASDTADTDMDTSSSASEGDMERDSVYGSCDSDHSLHDYYRQRTSSDQTKFKQVLSSLSDEVDESGQLALLTELCELLSFCSDNSLSSLIADSISPLLVRLAMHESNPNIMLLSIRAITYLCDVNPRSSGFLVRHDAIPALVQKLMVIEYLDVAEQSLQALEKISREQALACLQSGAIMAVLSYIDFFATSVQRVALSTVVNICNKLSPESPSLFMDAVPILCNLLQYEDKQLVESVATCLIKIGEQVNHSSDMLDEICKHGLVEHAVHLISLNSLTTLCQPTYVGLIGLLVKLASRSTVAFKTLFELNISNTVKDMLSTYDLSHGAQSSPIVDGHQNQIHEVLKLLNVLLPNIIAEQQDQLKADRETFLLNHPHILEKFGVDLLIILIQVVNSGVNLFTCYGCLSIINKIVHFSTANSLHSLLQSASFSSFLAGVFTRKDHHVVLLALQIVDTIMLKLPHVFLNSFIKEGVLFSIYALLSPDNDMKLYPVYDDLRLKKGPSKPASRDVNRCPCFSFDTGCSSPQNGICKLQSDTVQNLAEHIWTTYFQTESMNPEKGITDTLKKLRSLSGALMNQVNKFSNDVSSSQHDEEIYHILNEIMSNLNGKDSISTFEFVQSGIIKALVNYLLNSSHPLGEEENISVSHLYVMEKRFEVFGRLLLSCADPLGQEFPLLTLIQRTQSALSSVENFPVVISHKVKMMNSYATVPFERNTSYPCLKVQFLRENGEFYLDDYTDDVVNVDPFSPLKEIERFLWPRVSNGKTKKLALDSKDSSCSHSPSDSSTSQCKSADDTVSTETLEVRNLQQEGKHVASSPSPAETSNYEATNVTDFQKDSVEQGKHSPQEEGGMDTDHPVGRDIECTRPKLLFYLEGRQLNYEMSLYQTILDQQAVVENDDINNSSLWNRIYKITYRKHLIPQSTCDDEAQNSSLTERASYLQYTSFISRMLVSANDLEQLGQIYDISFLLKILEEINRLRCHLMSRARTCAFAEGRTESLNMLSIPVYEVCQTEFVNSKLTDKLEQQMRDPMTFTAGSMPIWCTQLMSWCPFLFGFEARHKYFHLSALGRPSVHAHIAPQENVGGSSSRQQYHGSVARKKFLVHRDKILESAAKMMKFHARQKVVLEVEYSEEVGTGLGPTLEFYTMVCQEFQRRGLGMWRDDHTIEAGNSEFLVSPFGLFPHPWSPSLSTSSTTAYSEVIAKFALLGQIVAKALQDGRILDLPFSKAFYKLILGKEITVFDIQSIDPALARTLLEFRAIVERKEHLISLSEDNSQKLDLCFRNTSIEDLCLDFTLPGYPDYVLSASDSMVNLYNLEEYVTLIVDATTKSGIYKQVEAFKSGFDQVFPISHLKVFTEEELERLLCGEQVMWNSNELTEHIKFDHGYTISSPPIINFLEIMQEFDLDQQRAFLQFTTGAPRLPTGGLASLNPKLTIVRKHSSNLMDADLPSVMTCANYLKLPPYSSKSVMKEKLLYAIIEGQGSFHLS